MLSITAFENYPELQEKQGIIISTVPFSFIKSKKTRFECEWIRNRLAETLGGTEANLDDKVEYIYLVKEIPYYDVTPNELIFKIRVHNNLARVLRLAGTVITFQIDNKMINLDRANYREFIYGFVIPRQEVEYRIRGTQLTSLPRKYNIALLLYDIVSEVDAAGNPTKRANFEWYLAYDNEIKQEQGIITKSIMRMTPVQARAMEARQYSKTGGILQTLSQSEIEPANQVRQNPGLGQVLKEIALGILILEISPGSPTVGRLQPGDIIKEINCISVLKISEFDAELSRFKIGDRVVLLIRRGGTDQILTIALQ